MRRRFSSRVLMETHQLRKMLGQEDLTILHSCLNIRPNFDVKGDHVRSRIQGATFFSIEEQSCKESQLPLTLPTEYDFRAAMRAMDVRITDTIVCYDSLGMLAAPRVSWMLRTFGAKNVFVLNGTFDKWLKESLPTSEGEMGAFSRERSSSPASDAYDYRLQSKNVECYSSIRGK